MKTFTKIASAVIAGALLAGVPLGAAQARPMHTPNSSASCSGVVLKATSYDGNKANTWAVTINGVSQQGTFGSSLDKTFPVPQGGATTTWKAKIAAFDGTYSQTHSGTVGPCGTPDMPVIPTPTVVEDSPRCNPDNPLQGDVPIKTTTYGWVLVNNGWVPATPVDTYTYRALTPAELLACAGPTPKDLVTYTEWTHGDYTCTDTQYTETREKSTIKYAYNPATGRFAALPAVKVTESQVHVLTPEELASKASEEACKPVVVPPVTPTPTPVPEDKSLARTGNDTNLLIGLGFGAAGALALGLTLLFGRRHASKVVEDDSQLSL